jgi:hypothetical protein
VLVKDDHKALTRGSYLPVLESSEQPNQ